MRTRNITQADIDLLNTRVVGSNQATTGLVAACAHLEERVAVVTNNTRRLINSQGLSTWLTYAAPCLPDESQPPLPIMLRGKYTKQKNESIAQSLLQTLPTLADTKFYGRIGNLLLALNAPIVVGDVVKYRPVSGSTEEVLGLGNGTTGTVYGMQFPPGTTFEVKNDAHGMPAYIEPSKTIRYLLLQIDNPKFPPFTGLPPGVYPLPPSPKSGKDKVKMLYLNQVPVTLRFSTTIHKLQGVTADYLTVGETRNYDSKGSNSVWHPAMLYVLLSRVRTLAGLHLLQPLTMADMEDFYSIVPGYNRETARLDSFVQASARDFPQPCKQAPDYSTSSPDARAAMASAVVPTPSTPTSTTTPAVTVRHTFGPPSQTAPSTVPSALNIPSRRGFGMPPAQPLTGGNSSSAQSLMQPLFSPRRTRAATSPPLTEPVSQRRTIRTQRPRRALETEEEPHAARRCLEHDDAFKIDLYPPWTVPVLDMNENRALCNEHQLMATQLATMPVLLPFAASPPPAVPTALSAAQAWVQLSASSPLRTHSFGMVPLICAIFNEPHVAIPYIRTHVVGATRWDCIVSWFQHLYSTCGITTAMMPWRRSATELYLSAKDQDTFVNFELAVMDAIGLDISLTPITAGQVLLNIWTAFVDHVNPII